MTALAPLVALLAVSLIVLVGWRDRQRWASFSSLQGRAPTAPTVLVLLGLGTTAVLYLLQATSLDASSMRYLTISWVFLPGLLASGLRRLRRGRRVALLAVLLTAWTVAAVALWRDIDRPSPYRPVVAELERRGCAGAVAQGAIAPVLAVLSDGRVGALQYQSTWPRLRDRYRHRFVPGRPVLCVVDPVYPGTPEEDLGGHLRALAAAHPGRVRPAGTVGPFQLWEADLPLEEVLAPAGGP